MYTKYLENGSIIVIYVMASFTVLNNCKQSSRKSRAPFQNEVAMATTVASTLIQFKFSDAKLNYIKSQKISFKSVQPF